MKRPSNSLFGLSAATLCALALSSCIQPKTAQTDPYGTPAADNPYAAPAAPAPDYSAAYPTSPAQQYPAPAQPSYPNTSSTSSSSTSHTVQKGDTLWGLSRKYGTSVSALQSANGLDSSTIVLGQTLVIPQ